MQLDIHRLVHGFCFLNTCIVGSLFLSSLPYLSARMNERIIRAQFDEVGITVYQAYHGVIANAAVAHQTFTSPPFKKDRMTWIKPSFLWMMYRSGWATKENQEHVLAIKLKHEGFTWALQRACLSHFDSTIHASYDEWKAQLADTPVRLQWDPEKDIHLQALPYRSIQIGLSGIAVEKYMFEWILQIDDITERCKTIHQLVERGEIDQAQDLLPVERHYPLPEDIALKIHSH